MDKIREENLKIEYYKDDNQECHLCGKVKKGRYLIHLYHLCQHYIALCPKCMEFFKTKINLFLRNERKVILFGKRYGRNSDDI